MRHLRRGLDRPERRAAADIAPGDDGPARPPRARRRGRPTATTTPRWGSAGCRSSTWPAAISRSPTRTAPSGRSSTARSTTSPRCGGGWRPRGTRSARRATPRSWSTSMRTRGRGCSACCAGCSPWRSGTRPAARWSWPATGLGQKPLVYRHDGGAAGLRQRAQGAAGPARGDRPATDRSRWRSTST